MTVVYRLCFWDGLYALRIKRVFLIEEAVPLQGTRRFRGLRIGAPAKRTKDYLYSSGGCSSTAKGSHTERDDQSSS